MWNVGAKQVMPMPKPAQSKYYTSVDSKSDLRLTDQYTVTIAQSSDLTNFAAGPVGDADTPDVTLGTLVLEYECILRTPQLSGTQSVGGIGGTTDVLNIALGGDSDSAQITSTNLLRIGIPAGATLTVFPPSLEVGPIGGLTLPVTQVFAQRSTSDANPTGGTKTAFYSDLISGNGTDDTISQRETLIFNPLPVETWVWFSIETTQAADNSYVLGISFAAVSDQPVDTVFIYRETEWFSNAASYNDSGVIPTADPQSSGRTRTREDVREALRESRAAQEPAKLLTSSNPPPVVTVAEEEFARNKAELQALIGDGYVFSSVKRAEEVYDLGLISFTEFHRQRAIIEFTEAMRRPSPGRSTRDPPLTKDEMCSCSESEDEPDDQVSSSSYVYISGMGEDPAHG